MKKLDVFVQRRMTRMLKRVAKTPSLGWPLRDELAGLFACDSTSYRASYTITDSMLIVHRVAHRAVVYDDMIRALAGMTGE